MPRSEAAGVKDLGRGREALRLARGEGVPWSEGDARAAAVRRWDCTDTRSKVNAQRQ